MYKAKPEANKKFSLSDATLLESHSSQVNISQKTLYDRTLWGKFYYQRKKMDDRFFGSMWSDVDYCGNGTVPGILAWYLAKYFPAGTRYSAWYSV